MTSDLTLARGSNSPNGDNNGVVRFVRSGERQFVVFCSDMEGLFGEEMALLATSSKVDKTVRGGVSNLWMAYTNPEYVKNVNAALEKIKSALQKDEFSKYDPRVKQLFLARALQWTDEIKCANQFSGIKDFDNRPMEELQDLLLGKGASREYSQLLSFFEGIAEVAFRESGPCFRYPNFCESNETKGTDPNGILSFQGGDWTLVPANNNPDQMSVLTELNKIVKAFKGEDVAVNMGDEEFLHGVALIGQVMTNYLKQVDESPAVSNQVFAQLNALHQVMSETLKGRSTTGLNIHLNETGLNDFKKTFGILRNVLRKSEFSEFYSKGEKVEMLKAADSILSPFITFHLTPSLMGARHSSWTFIGENKKEGVSVYKTKKDEVVVFFNGHSEYWDRTAFNAFAFSGGRGTEFGELNGLVHNQSLDVANRARDAMFKILQARNKEMGDFADIRFVGYGLDGSTAQLIGYDYKKTETGQNKNVMVIGCGVPPFLDETAAADMGNAMINTEGFQCINYAMAGDPNMRNLGVTGPVGMRYNNSAFITVPVPQGALFASEKVSGDTRKAYMQMLKTGQMMHFAMRNLFLEVEKCYELLEQVQPVDDEVLRLSASAGLITPFLLTE